MQHSLVYQSVLHGFKKQAKLRTNNIQLNAAWYKQNVVM